MEEWQGSVRVCGTGYCVIVLGKSSVLQIQFMIWSQWTFPRFNSSYFFQVKPCIFYHRELFGILRYYAFAYLPAHWDYCCSVWIVFSFCVYWAKSHSASQPAIQLTAYPDPSKKSVCAPLAESKKIAFLLFKFIVVSFT